MPKCLVPGRESLDRRVEADVGSSARGIQRWSCRAGAGRPGWAARCRRAWEERQIDRPGWRGRKRARETVLTGRFRFASVEEED